MTLELCSIYRKMIADIFGESGDEEEEEFTVSQNERQSTLSAHLSYHL